MARDGGEKCSVPLSAWVKKVSYGGVFDMAVEQPQPRCIDNEVKPILRSDEEKELV